MRQQQRTADPPCCSQKKKMRRDKAIEFKPVKTEVDYFFMVSESRQRTGRNLHILNIICSRHKGWPTRTGALEVSPPPPGPVVCLGGGTDILSIPPFAFPPPRCSKRGSIHPSIWPNQVWIELTAVRRSLPALRLQIRNLCRRLLRIFSSNINMGIVSYKYIKCHCWLASRY